ncbi:MAG: hypothetical protein DWG76_01510 [Chloroflexi bacterium]|nr:hypothetical protein [Chloroflexota bacterium]
MKKKIYHGPLNLDEVAQALAGFFNRGALSAQLSRANNQAFVQIVTRNIGHSGGRTSLGVALRQVEDRLEVEVGKQAVLGIAASLGATALLALRNPLNLLGRLDDVAQDFENLELDDQVWELVDRLAADAGASHEFTERLKRLTCDYCRVANPVGEGRCLACGAPLGDVQPFTCSNCGNVVLGNEKQCPNCGYKLD